MKINILGTGYGMAIDCYNTCFTIEKNNKHFLIDSGGGNTILKNLKQLNISLENIDSIFISHVHMDHIIGCLWIMRALLPKYNRGEIDNILKIYGNNIVIQTLNNMINMLMPPDFKYLFDDKIVLIRIEPAEEYIVLGKKITFFDINANKTLQYGFSLSINNNKKFVFIGDEYCKKTTEKYIENANWLFADAYMCGDEAEKYNPIARHSHSTVKYISMIAKKNNVKKLILSHTIDRDLNNRKKEFTQDAKKYFDGEVLIPDDLDVILLK